MLKKKILINKKDLAKCVELVELSGEAKGLTDFYKKVAKKYTELFSKSISYATVSKRMIEFDIKTNTKSSKGLHLKGLVQIEDENPPKENSYEYIEHLKKYVPKSYHGRVKKVLHSKVAAIHLKCLDCTCYQPREIAECEISSCSLWNYRPYKKKNNNIVEEIPDQLLSAKS